MTCMRDIIDAEALEREFDSIRKFFEAKTKDEVLRIEWGTKAAFEQQERPSITQEAQQALDKIVSEHSAKVAQEAERIAIARGHTKIFRGDVIDAIREVWQK